MLICAKLFNMNCDVVRQDVCVCVDGCHLEPLETSVLLRVQQDCCSDVWVFRSECRILLNSEFDSFLAHLGTRAKNKNVPRTNLL